MRDGDAPELLHALRERVKELQALHATARLMLRDDLSLAGQLRAVCELLPRALQFPEVATAAVRHGALSFATPGHASTAWRLSSTFQTDDGALGELEVAYHEPRGDAADGPFLAEEASLLASIADMLRGSLERRQALERLQFVNERLGLALAAAGMGVWEWDVARGQVTWCEQVARMTGLQITSGPFASQRELVHPEDREMLYTRLARAAAGADDLEGLSFRFRRPEGGWRHMVAKAMITRTPEGGASRVVAALIDVSERRVLEEGLRQAQKVEALGQLASGVAHDFNNLLSVALPNADLLRAEIPPDHPWHPLAEELYEACERGKALTTQLLTFSRQATFTPARVDLSRLVTRMKPLLARIAHHPLELVHDLDPAAGEIWADPTQIEQVLLNLVVNARDAMPGGGTIVVRTFTARRSAAPGPYAGLEVRDRGPGVPPELTDRLFEPFFTTKPPGKGTGLGLAVVSATARQWQGLVEVDSEPGAGATFRVLFPRLPA